MSAGADHIPPEVEGYPTYDINGCKTYVGKRRKDHEIRMAGFGNFDAEDKPGG